MLIAMRSSFSGFGRKIRGVLGHQSQSFTKLDVPKKTIMFCDLALGSKCWSFQFSSVFSKHFQKATEVGQAMQSRPCVLNGAVECCVWPKAREPFHQTASKTCEICWRGTRSTHVSYPIVGGRNHVNISIILTYPRYFPVDFSVIICYV